MAASILQIDFDFWLPLASRILSNDQLKKWTETLTTLIRLNCLMALKRIQLEDNIENIKLIYFSSSAEIAILRSSQMFCKLDELEIEKYLCKPCQDTKTMPMDCTCAKCQHCNLAYRTCIFAMKVLKCFEALLNEISDLTLNMLGPENDDEDTSSDEE